MPKDNLKEQLELLYEAPMLIKLAKEAINFLPKGKERDEVIRAVLNVKNALIDLDVRLQDLEWSLLERELKSKNFLNE